MAAWERYIARHPPGEDRRLHVLVGHLCAMLARAWGGDKAKHVDLYTFAPWLRSPGEAKAERQVKSDTFVESMFVDVFASIGVVMDGPEGEADA